MLVSAQGVRRSTPGSPWPCTELNPPPCLCLPAASAKGRYWQEWCYQRCALKGPAAHHSKDGIQARLVERKVCLFQMPATGGGEGGRQLSEGQFTPCQAGGRAFIDKIGVVTCRKSSTVLSNSHLQTGHLPSIIASSWLSWVQIIFGSGVHLFPFLRISSQKCGGSSPGDSLAIMQLTSPPGVLESIRQLTGHGSKYHL